MDEEWFGYSKNPDPFIKKLPKKFQRFLHERWDDFAATQKAHTLGLQPIP
jgi:hypothetical protein